MSDQAFLSTDIGPVIEGDALAVLETHSARITASARWHHQVRFGPVQGTPLLPLLPANRLQLAEKPDVLQRLWVCQPCRTYPFE